MIEHAAVRWWKSKRPTHWDLYQHLDNPTVNTSTVAEEDLAAAVAAHEQARIAAAIEAVEEARNLSARRGALPRRVDHP